MPFVLFKVIQGVVECDCVAEKGCQGTDKHDSSTSSKLRLESKTLTDPYFIQSIQWKAHLSSKWISHKTGCYNWIFGYWTSVSFLQGCLHPAYKVFTSSKQENERLLLYSISFLCESKSVVPQLKVATGCESCFVETNMGKGSTATGL